MAKTRRTREQIAQLESQIVSVLRTTHPLSVRHVFYRMTDPRLQESVEKTERGYAQICHRLKKMRKEGRIKYGWISDATRRGWHVNTWDSPGEFAQSVAELYRRDLWSWHSDTLVEVWCESRSIAGVIEQTCRSLAVSLYPTGGFSSLTLIYEAAYQINNRVREFGFCKVVILYVGDYDPAGVLIDQKIHEDMQGHLRTFQTPADVDMKRIAINHEQIEQYNLPTRPRKESERRRRDIEETVEAESMDASVLRQMLSNEILSYLPEDAVAKTKAVEESERKSLVDMAMKLKENGM